LSQFYPVNISIEPPLPADAPAVAVLQALARPIGQKQAAWTVVRSLFWATISFGVIPIATWIDGFRAYVTAEQLQYVHLARWVRRNSHHPLARRLEEDAEELSARSWLWLIPLLAVIGTLGMFVFAWHYASENHWGVRRFAAALIEGTYAAPRLSGSPRPIFANAVARGVFGVWCGVMGVAYFCQLLQVQLHALDVRRFVARFSQIAQADGVNRVRAETPGLGLRPLWVAAGVVMFMIGAPWGVLAMLAGGAQRRYITTVSRKTRAEVALRLRAMVIRRTPADGVLPPVPVYLRERCVEPKCRAQVLRGANYCPRCGTRQKAQIDRVA
jgi:hypothetical protein